MNKLNMETKDIINDNIEYIKNRFPNAVNEDGINFDILKQELSNVIIDDKKERYELTWPGKKEAILNANKVERKTLRPLKDKSVDFDNTQNIYIEGDNLEVLKILQESYLNKIKCIYIDPPYNTGKDFIYNDNFNKDATDELNESGQIDEYGNRLITNNLSNGRFHSDWLSMMYPRLKLARNLLTNDGVIFISIDDNEQANLKKLCDEIFGEKNKIGLISVINNMKGRSDSANFATCNEFLLCYSKKYEHANIKGFNIESDEIDNDYIYEDEISKYKLVEYRKTGNGWKREDRPFMFYPVLYKEGVFNTITSDEYKRIYNIETKTFDDDYIAELRKKYENLNYLFILPTDKNGNYGRWRWGLDKFYLEKDINLELNDNNNNVCTKMRATIEDGSLRVKTAKTLWYKPEYDTGSGAKILNMLFDNVKIFDNPKSFIYISDILKIATDSDSIILDFFSGSATTAHACMELNAEDGGHRKYIMVQMPEKSDEKSEAYKNGYKNICEIGEERIRRAATKIKNETQADIDYGVRVYKVDSSNMKEEFYLVPSEYDQHQLSAFENNIKDGRTPIDLLTQVILDLGLTLDLKFEEKIIDENKIYIVNENQLIACFDNNVSDKIIDEISNIKPSKIVFRDSSFNDDKDKFNFEEKLKKLSPNTEFNVL